MTKQVSSTDSSSLALSFPVWLFPFQFGYLLLLFPIWLLWVEFPMLCGVEVVSRHPCLVLQLMQGFQLFTFGVLCWLWIQCKLLFITLRYVSFIPTLVRFLFLSWMGVEFCQIPFLHLLRRSCVCVFFLNSWILMIFLRPLIQSWNYLPLETFMWGCFFFLPTFRWIFYDLQPKSF